jgi:putative hemolysin
MYPEAIASVIALPMKWLSRLAAPLVWLLSISSDAILRMMAIRPPKDLPVTPEELKVLIKQGADAGVIERTEQSIVSNVFRMADRRASAIMTPRTEIVWIDVEDEQDTIRKKIIDSPHSQFPVAQDSLDNAVGLLMAKDCLARVLNGQPIVVEEMMHRPLIVPESISTLQLLESFRENPAQVALVSNEYGSILGLVTQNELLETLVGELQSPEPPGEPEAVQREDGSWLVNGAMAADDFCELVGLSDLPNRNQYDTMAGFVLMQLQRIPQAGDHFEWNGCRFEIMDMDGRRIDKILAVLPSDSSKVDEAEHEQDSD